GFARRASRRCTTFASRRGTPTAPWWVPEGIDDRREVVQQAPRRSRGAHADQAGVRRWDHRRRAGGPPRRGLSRHHRRPPPRRHGGQSFGAATTSVPRDLDFIEQMEEAKFPRKYGAAWTSSAQATHSHDFQDLPSDYNVAVRFEERQQPGVDRNYTYHVDRG